MSLPQFEAHIHSVKPQFRCYKSGDKSKALTFSARVTNRIGKLAESKALSKLDQLVKTKGTEIRKFYELHDGAVLYQDPLSDAAGIEFFVIRSWAKQTREVRKSLDAMGFPLEEMPEWFSSGIVFGEIPNSANGFLLATNQTDEGKIFYIDHDDFRDQPLANTFNEFLGLVVSDPAELLLRVGCYTRYSDGKTNAQWIPAEFVVEA